MAGQGLDRCPPPRVVAVAVVSVFHRLVYGITEGLGCGSEVDILSVLVWVFVHAHTHTGWEGRGKGKRKRRRKERKEERKRTK